MWNWFSFMWNRFSIVLYWFSVLWNWDSYVRNWMWLMWHWMSLMWIWVSFVWNRLGDGIVIRQKHEVAFQTFIDQTASSRKPSHPVYASAVNYWARLTFPSAPKGVTGLSPYLWGPVKSRPKETTCRYWVRDFLCCIKNLRYKDWIRLWHKYSPHRAIIAPLNGPLE